MSDRWQEALRRLSLAKRVVVDVETSGLSWQKNAIVGYVLTFGPSPSESFYLPVRHGGGGNLLGHPGLTAVDSWDGSLHPIEADILKGLDRQDVLLQFHNASFDLRFMWQVGYRLNAQHQDSIINAPLLNEYQEHYSLEFCCKTAGVAAKKSDLIKDYLISRFPGGGLTPRNAMGHFWRLAGDDPMAVEYAEGDGTSTWQLIDWQDQQLAAQELGTVHKVESDLIPVLARMSVKGIKVDEERLHWLKGHINEQLDRLLEAFPVDFSSRSPSHVRKWCEDHGATDWPLTPKGAPSFNEAWLETHEPGKAIIKLRKLSNLRDSFVNPLIETHLWKGRVHTDFNQLRGDEYGTVTGRLSSSNPNLQQIPKRNRELGKLFRSVFVPDEGMIWGDVDYRQCLAAGTKITVPGGTKNIEDVKVGDLVYSFDAQRRPCIRKVTWAGQTGMKPLVRVHWKTTGRTKGTLDLTADHPIRLVNGQYKTPAELSVPLTRKLSRGWPYWVPVLAMRRVQRRSGSQDYQAIYIQYTGDNNIKESRFIFEQLHGWLPEHVHHIDGNSLNNDPTNLEAIESGDHARLHGPFGMKHLSPDERLRRSRRATKALQKKFRLINNHAISHIEPLLGVHPVYDITVEDTHNFIANEICVHNCEPVLLAFYSRAKVLVDGFRSVPPVDAHAAVTRAMRPEWRDMPDEEFFRRIAKGGDLALTFKDARETGKRVNQTLITGGGKKTLALKYKIENVDRVWDDYFGALPEIRDLQRKASRRFEQRGYLLSLLGRRARLIDRGKSYTGVNRLLQCGNADVLKAKLVEVDAYLASEGRPLDILNNVHDAMSYQFPEAARRHYEECLRIMTDFSPGQLIEIDVPLGVDAGEGPTWGIATYGEE